MIDKINIKNLISNTGQIKDVPKNPRFIKDGRFEALKKSIEDTPELLELRELIVYPFQDKFIVVAGNMRFRAMKALGYIDLPCKILDENLEPKKIREIIIKDNRPFGSDDFDLLANEWDIEELLDLGFEDFELGLAEIEEPVIEEDEVPALKTESIVKKGDLWVLGKHLLKCGDATNIDDVKALMGEEKADMVYTDPPYGISIVSTTGQIGGEKLAKVGTYAPVANDDSINVAIAALSIIKIINAKVEIIWGGNYYSSYLDNSSCWIVWDKDNTGNFADAELAWTNQKTAVRIFKHMWNGMIKASENGQARVHPTQKPIALAVWCFKEYGKTDYIVIDLFGGSGSTLIACEQTDRKCRMMELDAHYCQVIIDRYIKLKENNGEDVFLMQDGKQIPYKDFVDK